MLKDQDIYTKQENKNIATIWHNPKCSKSREAYNIIEMMHQPVKSFEYLNEIITKDQILDIMKKLEISDIRDMLRDGEEEYKTYDLSNKDKTQDEIIQVVLDNHILIQRPIIIKNNKAVIARPMDNLIKLLEK